MKPKFQKLILDIQVHDLDRAIAFYRDVLGFSMIHKASDWASFEALGAELHLYLNGGAEYGLEFRVSDLAKEIGTLKDKGVQFFVNRNQPNLEGIDGEVMRFPWGKAAYFKDSEGNQIALVEDL